MPFGHHLHWGVLFGRPILRPAVAATQGGTRRPKSTTSVIPAKSLPRTRYGAGIHPRRGECQSRMRQSATPYIQIRWGIWVDASDSAGVAFRHNMGRIGVAIADVRSSSSTRMVSSTTGWTSNRTPSGPEGHGDQRRLPKCTDHSVQGRLYSRRAQQRRAGSAAWRPLTASADANDRRLTIWAGAETMRGLLAAHSLRTPHSLGSTGSLSSASTAKAHSCTR